MEGIEMNKNLKNIVEELKLLFLPKEVPFDRIYDAIMEINRCTAGLAPGQTEEEWTARFIKKYGTKEEFIAKSKMPKEGNYHAV
jgi:hypothetical protein